MLFLLSRASETSVISCCGAGIILVTLMFQIHNSNTLTNIIISIVVFAVAYLGILLCIPRGKQQLAEFWSYRNIVNPEDVILVTGAAGFVGAKVLQTLLSYGFTNLRCFVKPTSNARKLESIINDSGVTNVEIVQGNLISRMHQQCCKRRFCLSSCSRCREVISRVFPELCGDCEKSS